jgi:hypothetical protein
MDALDASGYGLAVMTGGLGILLASGGLWSLWLLWERIADRVRPGSRRVHARKNLDGD